MDVVEIHYVEINILGTERKILFKLTPIGSLKEA